MIKIDSTDKVVQRTGIQHGVKREWGGGVKVKLLVYKRNERIKSTLGLERDK